MRFGLSRIFTSKSSGTTEVKSGPNDDQAINKLSLNIKKLNDDPYLYLPLEAHGLVSVFDDLKYDRADLDMVSGPMRRRAISKLTPLGFQQVTGGMLRHAACDVRVYIPQFRALGASPFDASRDVSRRPRDYVLLTPTQAACEIIETTPVTDMTERLERLCTRHPVNLLRIFDFLEDKASHRAFKRDIGYLTHVQRTAVEKDPLCRRRALR